ncbi:MAG: DegV family EDD domain-containing protein [Clostridia bacterium]|nr:DegV family EDD domain-containing protein [Clostridia bacterium]
MKPYVILTDAACDADAAVLKKENISFIPMDYSLGDEMRSCLPPELPAIMKAFYDGQRKGDLTKTSQVSLSSYEAAMLPWLEKGFSILYLALSSCLSSTYQTAATVCELLQERFPNATILAVDTKAATGGMGILLERAIQNREKGLGVCENAMDLMETIPHLHHWFMVQDIQYLHRGGRLGTVTATVGTVFRLRPISTSTPTAIWIPAPSCIIPIPISGKRRCWRACARPCSRRTMTASPSMKTCSSPAPCWKTPRSCAA